MVGLFDRFRKRGVDIEEALGSLDLESDLSEEEVKAWVMPVELNTAEDVNQLRQQLDNGNIVLINIKGLKRLGTERLKEVVAQLKEAVKEIDGDIARISEDKIMVTPNGVKFWKR